MIIELKEEVSASKAQELAGVLQAFLIHNGNRHVLINSSKTTEIPEPLLQFVANYVNTGSDIQLASKKYQASKRNIKIGDIEIGGHTNNTLLMTGPCSVESETQIEEVAQYCVKQGVKVLRAGCYKPRTSPYTFQGLGKEGLMLLVKMREKYGLKIITEVRDASHVDDVIEHADIIQIGSKAMYDHGILKACGKTQKPVLLKRFFGATAQEFVQSAEFIMSGGNLNVILCERGIRTYEDKTRFTLDLCTAAWIKEYTHLPLVLDPSHAMGYSYGVPDLARACVAMGIDGLLIETHPNPKIALSDASQQLNFEEFANLQKSLNPVAEAVGYKMI